MESFRPYTWLKKHGTPTQFNLFYSVSIPSGFRVSGGLQSPVDDAMTGIRTYEFNVESNLPSSASVVDSSVGDHSQSANISKIVFQVVDVTDSGRPVKKGSATGGYDDADGVS